MKRLFDVIPLLLLVALAAALFYVGQPGAQDAGAAQNKPDSAEVARTDSLDALLRPDSVSAVDSLPEKLQPLKPKYPESARVAGLEGVVWVKVLISRNGNVLKATILKREGGNADMETSALNAATQITYRPAIVKGQPVAIWVTYAVNYKLFDKETHQNEVSPKK